MSNETGRAAVHQREDAWVEVPARYTETGYASDPIQLRPGTSPDFVAIGPNSVHEVRIADITEALQQVASS
jgi:hypothetical protein